MPQARIQPSLDTADDDPVLDLIMELPPRLRREALCWLLINGKIGVAARNMLVVCYTDILVELVPIETSLFREVGGN